MIFRLYHSSFRMSFITSSAGNIVASGASILVLLGEIAESWPFTIEAHQHIRPHPKYLTHPDLVVPCWDVHNCITFTCAVVENRIT